MNLKVCKALVVMSALVAVGCAVPSALTFGEKTPAGASQPVKKEAESGTGSGRKTDDYPEKAKPGPTAEKPPSEQDSEPKGAESEDTRLQSQSASRSMKRDSDTLPSMNIGFGAERASLTKYLSDARDRLKTQNKEIEELRTAIEEARTQLARVKEERDNLEKKLETQKERVSKLQEALKSWKKKVLGFRDEMRQAEQAEMQTLKKIIVLLQQSRRRSEGSQDGSTASPGQQGEKTSKTEEGGEK